MHTPQTASTNAPHSTAIKMMAVRLSSGWLLELPPPLAAPLVAPSAAPGGGDGVADGEMRAEVGGGGDAEGGEVVAFPPVPAPAGGGGDADAPGGSAGAGGGATGGGAGGGGGCTVEDVTSPPVPRRGAVTACAADTSSPTTAGEAGTPAARVTETA